MAASPAGISGMRTASASGEKERIVAPNESNLIVLSRRNRTPVTVTGSPGVPASGITELICGDGSSAVENVNALDRTPSDAPLQRMATVTFPAACGGVSPIISALETKGAVGPATLSKNGQQPLWKFDPSMRTSVPPGTEPNDGATDDTTGVAAK